MADNFDNYGMKVRATVDLPSVDDIDKQIRKLEKSISKLQVSGKLDDASLRALSHQLDTLKATVTTANFSSTALTELTNQVNRALENVRIDNINIGNVNNQAQQVGQQIGQQINEGIKQNVNVDDVIEKAYSKYLSLTGKKSSAIFKGQLNEISPILQNDIDLLEKFSSSIDGFNDASELRDTVNNFANIKTEIESVITATNTLNDSANRSFDIDTTTAQQEVKELITITDNYGRELDEIHSKLLSTSKMMNTQGKLITLFHGSPSEFDSFKINTRGRFEDALGVGGYFYDNPSNSIGYGNVSQWFANVEKIFDTSSKLSAEEIQSLYDKYKKQIKEIFDIDNLFDFSSDVNKNPINSLKSLSTQMGYDSSYLMRELGYDAIIDRGATSTYVILDEKKIIKANSALKEQVSLITDVKQATSMEENADPQRNWNQSVMDAMKAKRESSNQEISLSTSTTNTVIQNEEKKQQAIQETARIAENLNNEDSSDKIKELAVEKAKARDEINELRKKIEDETGVKVSVSDIKQAQKEIDQANKVQQEGTRENIKLREQEVAHTRMLAKETKANADLEVANRQREMKLENQSASEELANRKRVTQEQKIATQEELTSREQVRKLNEQTFKEESSARKQAAAELKLQAQEQRALQSSLNAPEKRINRKLDNDVYSTDIDKLKQKFQDYGLTVEQAETKVKTLRDTLTDMKGLSGDELIKKANEWDNAFEKVKVQLDQTRLAYDQLSEVNKIQLSWSDGSYEAKYDSLIAKTRQWVNANDESVISTQKLTTAYNEFNTAASNFAKDGSVKNRDILIQKEEELGRQLKATTNDIKVQNAEWAKSSKVDSLHQKIQEFYDKNTATHRTWGSQLKNMLNETAHGAQVTATRVNEIEQEFLGVSNAARQAGKLGQSFFGSIKEQASKFVQWFSVTSVVMEGVQAIKKMTQEVIAVDSAMVELRKVSDASNNDLKKYFDEAAKSAKDLGAAVSDVISATADWSRLGYSLDDSKKLAEVAILYKNVGDGIDVDTANESLVSTLRGFQLSAEDAMNIVDQFNEVANNFPIDSAGIGEALQRSAASFYEANTDLSKSIALITGTNSVIQDPDSVGTMWKTVSMRIRGATAELEEAGLETEGMVETTSQLQALVKGMTGFDIMKDEDTFKDIYEIVIGIGNEWQNLSDIEQASLLEALAGKRQGNTLAAALNNISMIEDAYNTATNSAGSALEEQEEYEKGIQYSLDRLEAKFQEFSNHVLESELIKGIVDFGTTTLDVVDKVISALGSLGTIGVIGGGILGGKNIGRPKMFGLVLKYADNHMCSLGY